MNRYFFTLIILIAIGLTSCQEESFVPKPRGYMRFDFPEQNYEDYTAECPFSFPISKEAFIRKASGFSAENCILDLHYPDYKATVHITYRKVNGNLIELMQNSRDLAMQHTVKASAMDQIRFDDGTHKVHGVLFDIQGNVASNIQFHLTDSSDHFFRAALYFATAPNADSLAPVIDHIRTDLDYLIDEFEWASQIEQ